MGNEDDWGLEGLIPRGSSAAARQQQRRGRRSLLDELEAEESAADGFEEGSLAASNNASVQWGGSAGFTGIDLEEQEDMLRRYFKPQEVQKLMKDQQEIESSYSELRVSAVMSSCHSWWYCVTAYHGMSVAVSAGLAAVNIRGKEAASLDQLR
jgi:hypothetical protein